MYQGTKSHSRERKPNQVMAINISLRLFVDVYKLVNVVLTLEWYCIPVNQVS